MQLIIVESPTKARTLTRFLGAGDKYRIEATMGHIRDLPKSELGVDVEHNFEPKYIVPRDKSKRVKELKELAKKADSVILATDPDREGEAIAWHIGSILTEARSKKKKTSTKSEVQKVTFARIVFHEITESAIKKALEHPREIDLQLVDAQQARRILDRLVGYKLSPLLWQKLSRRWLSAGRVQSVAVRLIVEREREINKFQKEEFWTIEGEFNTTNLPAGRQVLQIKAQLIGKDGNKYEKNLSYDLFDGKYTTASSTINSQQNASAIITDFKTPFVVNAVDKKEIRRFPTAPFTTSTLQQEAGRKLYFSAKRTMQLAQKLYEEGLITYHRTDSVNLSEKFIEETRDYIVKTYGNNYVPKEAKHYQTKSKVAQEAHEAIRPTDVRVNSSAFVDHSEINKDHLHLYDLIWKRAVASQAAEAIFDSTTINIKSANEYLFQTQGSVIKFDGFLKITGREIDETILPDVTINDSLNLKLATPLQHFTNPPPRYTEASLIKTLEEKSIGRPSTYAPIISTIQDRQYVIKEEKKLVPTDLGGEVTDFLVKYFSEIMELPFTANLEDSLDAIANGEKQWVPVIAEFYEPFAKTLEKVGVEAERVKLPEEATDEECPDCGNQLVIRVGKFGKFIACTNFPNCKYTRQLAQKIDVKCPRCDGDVVIKKTRSGKTFYGCSNYPKCNFAAWKKEDIK